MAEKQVAEITGIDIKTAKQYLEMTNGDANRAVDLIFSGAEVRKTPRIIKPKTPRPNNAAPSRTSVAPKSIQPLKTSNEIINDIFTEMSQKELQKNSIGDQSKGKHSITFYKNGFIVDDGEFRENSDPKNADFLSSVNKAQIPEELRDKCRPSDLDVIDKREEEYIKPKTQPNVFIGQSKSIGGDTNKRPTTASNQNSSRAPNTFKDFANPNLPSTKIRLQLEDSSILSLSINLSTTIRELKKYISQCRPEYIQNKIKLVLNVPHREITNDAGTIESEGLKMSQIQVSSI
ncbi:hypothetical protein TVAG_369330 [Trichomonas vaginalis G3]|uniref:Uncharacterized protein n=1 Tax=Trichomonas vaginalis (strain ATCC PRA-98 / G3) TaxID=412133 RepID=A2FGF9_TRIV3|nr:nuclear envelope reassembly [Trichomonas vaginalis G3]EAX96023.1 hypothetical protein TVAG_369330 [Trichomonas vaginalis G3]KAI5537098.1 nuclear envelope reassembly [Trichomonas vaginalis G3]|eukprot:XP_001308953.1 hypothetical protein [Trichomonas vaginalis G3]